MKMAMYVEIAIKSAQMIIIVKKNIFKRPGETKQRF